jgi:hypothetical protein
MDIRAILFDFIHSPCNADDAADEAALAIIALLEPNPSLTGTGGVAEVEALARQLAAARDGATDG